MRIVVSDTAKQDLVETLHFLNAPSARGKVFNDTVDEALRHLRRWPYTGHRRRELTKRDVCFWTEGDYHFVLSIRDEVLTVIAVLNAKRDIARILRKRLKRPL